MDYNTNVCIGWVVVGIMWLFFSTFCVGIFPLWQGRKTAAHTIKSMFNDLTGKKKHTLQGRVQDVSEDESGRVTPTEKTTVVAEKTG